MILSTVADGDEADVYRSLKARGAPSTASSSMRYAARTPGSSLLGEIALPFVVHGRSSEYHGDYSWVDSTTARPYRRATRFLLDLGHRRIGLVNGDEEMGIFAWRRRRGYESGANGSRHCGRPGALLQCPR